MMDSASRADHRPAAAQVMECYLSLSETFIYDVVVALRRFRPIVAAARLDHPERFPIPAGASLFVSPPTRGSFAWLRNALLRRAVGGFPDLERRLRRERAAVIHAHFGPAACRVTEVKGRTGLPLAASFYGYDVSVRQVVEEFRERYARLFRTGDVFLVEGPAMARRLAALGCPPDKLRIQRIGIVPSRYAFRERRDLGAGPLVVLQCGRLVAKKGYGTSLRALAIARRRHPRLVLRVIGDGPDRPAIEGQIRELGLADAVTLLGAQPREVFIRELASADLFLQPSRTAPDGDSEGGAPTTLLEAQASGLPIVATRHADIPFVVSEGRSALLGDEDDAEAVAAHLSTLAGAPERWAGMGRAGRAFVEEHHDVAHLVEDLENLYEGLASGRNPAKAG